MAQKQVAHVIDKALEDTDFPNFDTADFTEWDATFLISCLYDGYHAGDIDETELRDEVKACLSDSFGKYASLIENAMIDAILNEY